MGLGSIIKGGIGGFIGSGFNPIGAGIGAISGYAQGRQQDKFEDAQQRVVDINNQYQQQVDEARRQQMESEMRAMAEQIAAQQEAQRATTAGQRQAFDITRQSGDVERGAQERLARGLQEFGVAKKKAGLKEAKKKRGGSAAKAAKEGGSVRGKRAGRTSRAYTSSLADASRKATNQAADFSRMRGELTGYGADQAREFDEFGDLAVMGAADRTNIGDLRRVAASRNQLAGQEGRALSEAAAQQYRIAMAQARELGYVPPQPDQIIKPNYGVWDDVSDIAGLAMIGLGSGAFGGGGSGDYLLTTNPQDRQLTMGGKGFF